MMSSAVAVQACDMRVFPDDAKGSSACHWDGGHGAPNGTGDLT